MLLDFCGYQKCSFLTSFGIAGGGWLVEANGGTQMDTDGRNGIRQAQAGRSGQVKRRAGRLPRSGGHPPVEHESKCEKEVRPPNRRSERRRKRRRRAQGRPTCTISMVRTTDGNGRRQTPAQQRREGLRHCVPKQSNRTPFDRFESLAKRLVSVPKEEAVTRAPARKGTHRTKRRADVRYGP